VLRFRAPLHGDHTLLNAGFGPRKRIRVEINQTYLAISSLSSPLAFSRPMSWPTGHKDVCANFHSLSMNSLTIKEFVCSGLRLVKNRFVIWHLDFIKYQIPI
jgi:hypothetical protein